MGADLPVVVAHVVDVLKAEGLHATADPRALRVPGVLVQWTGVEVDLLDGATHDLRLLLVAADRDDPRTLASLSDLLDAVIEVIDPAGRIASRGVMVPTHPSPLPGLEYPVQVVHTQE